MSIVLNKRIDRIPADAVYVGRPSIYGNPFVIGRDGSRADVVAEYRTWLMVQSKISEADIKALHGKDLVCWCSPAPCHADVLLEVTNQLFG